MYRLMPFRRQGLHTFPDLFNWPDFAWQGFHVDVKETPEGYAVQADLPGVNKENIKLSLDNGYLTIAVQQDNRTSEEKEDYIRRERRQVSSQRSFYVGQVNKADVEARYEDGVLEVKFPKASNEANDREIQIQ